MNDEHRQNLLNAIARLDALPDPADWPKGWSRCATWPGPPYVSITVRRKWWLARGQGWSCFYCLTPLTILTAELEHMFPVSRGGTDDPENLCLSCSWCNNDKGSMTVAEYITLLAARRVVV